MFDLGWTELLLIGIVALIVVGPKDLPQLFRTLGRFMGKARGMAREFSRAMNDAADQAGVSEINKTIKAAANPAKAATDTLRSAASIGPETEALAKKQQENRAKIDAVLDAKKRETEAKLASAAEEAADAALAAEEMPPVDPPAPEPDSKT